MREALEIDKKVYGNEHPDVAIDLNNLAALLRDTGRRAEAKKSGVQAYNIALKALGANHPDMKTYNYWLTLEE